METVKIVFDIDTKDVKTSTQELQALNKVTNDEVASLNKLSTAAEDAGDGFVSLRTQVKQAKEEAQKAAEKYGEFSTQANAARQRAGALADQMGDLNRQVNLLNPEAKAKAFSNLASGVVGAFSIATGALQAFGVKNKEVEEIAMKLQAALNITQGIASIGSLKEAYQDVKVVLGFTVAAQEAMVVATEAEAVASTQAAVATRGFTAALLTNPIFLAVAAIAALAGAMIALSDDTEEAEKEVVKMTESQKELRSASNAAAAAADDLAVAQGNLSKEGAAARNANRENASSIEDLNEKIRINNSEIAKNNKVIREGNKDYADAVAKNALRRADLREDVKLTQIVGQEYIDAAKNLARLKKENEDITKTIKAKNEATKISIETLNEEKKTADTNKQIEDAKKLAAERKQAAKEEEAAAKERLRLADELRKKLQENALAEISDPAERIRQARQFANENYAIEEERLVLAKASQDERDKLAADHTALIIKLDNDEINSNKAKNDKILAGEKKLKEAVLALALAEETDPVKRAQIINDAKEAEIDNQLALVEKGSKEEQALLLDKQRFEIEAQKRVADAIVQINKDKDAEIEKSEMARYNREKEAMDRTIQATNELFNTLSSIQAANYNQETIDAQKQKEKGLISEEEYQKKLLELKRRQDIADKNAAIFKATLDFASALINALKAPPLAVPAQLAFTAAIAGLNLAKIIATPLPRYQQGTLSVPGMDMGKDSVHAMLQPGEAVIPVSTNRAYHPTIKAIYENKISPSEINSFVMNRTKGATSSTNMTASVDTYALGRVLSKNKGVQIENANLVGKAIARELGNRFNPRQYL
jgi:hypothetical protein